MKKIVRRALLPLILISLVLFAGCPDPGTDTPEDDSAALINSVWMGTTPQADGTGWLTITFKAENKVIWAFSADNTTNEWNYTFNTADKGTISVPSGWNPCPNGFTVSGDTLTVTNYGNHEGDPRSFKQVRKADLTVTDPVPFTPGTLANDLVGSVWGGLTPQGNGTGWLTITFTADNKVIWAFSFDNTTNEWGYTFNATDGGTITVPSGWNPCPNGFTINDGGDTLTVTHYGSHAGDPRSFKRYR